MVFDSDVLSEYASFFTCRCASYFSIATASCSVSTRFFTPLGRSTGVIVETS